MQPHEPDDQPSSPVPTRGLASSRRMRVFRLPARSATTTHKEIDRDQAQGAEVNADPRLQQGGARPKNR